MAEFKDKCTIIGPTVSIRGKLKSDEDLVIRGRIDASIASSKLVHVDKDGVVKANIEAESVLVSGVVLGDVTASARVELMGTARVVGDIASPLMVINDGARLKGKIDMPAVDRAMEEKYVEPPRAAKPAARPIEPARKEPVKPIEPAIPKAINSERGTEPTGMPKSFTNHRPPDTGRRPGTGDPVRPVAMPDSARKPLPGVDAKPVERDNLDIDAIVDAFGIEPEVEEVEIGDDQEVLSIYDVDAQAGSDPPTLVGGNPLSAKKN